MTEDATTTGTDEDSTEGKGDDEFARWHAETRRALADADTGHIEVYVRSLLPPPGAKDAQTAAITSLRSAIEGTPVEDVAVNVWGERLCLCEACLGTDAGRVMLNTVREFERWGTEYDASAEPFFERTRRESSVTGASYEGIVPPRVTAALYLDGSLVGVFPARFGETHYSVGDLSETLAGLTGPEAVADPLEQSH
jgi:hypothetical protein